MKIYNRRFIESFMLSFKDYRFNSIFIKNYKLILLVVVIPILLLTFVIFSYNTKIINQQIENTNKSTLIKLKNEFDSITQISGITAVKLANYNEVRTFSGKDNLYDSFENLELIDKIQKQISYEATTNDAVSDIVIHFRKTDYFIAVNSSWTGFNNNYPRNIPPEMINYDEIQQKEIRYVDYGESMFLKQYIKSFGEILGTVIIKSDDSVLISKAKKTFQNPESRMFILDPGNNIIVDSQNINIKGKLDEYYPKIGPLLGPDYLYGFIDIDGVKSIVSVMGSGDVNWRYVLISPIGIYKQSILDMKYVIILLILLILLFTLVVAWMITYKLYRPIQIIIDVIKNKNGSFKELEESDYKSMDEVGFISSSIKNSQIQNIIIRTELESKMDLLKRAQTVALQAQINPHFLYNTLESINWKALQLLKGQNDISEMVNALSKLLRLSLDSKNHIVSIGTELQHVKLYIQIQKYRFKDRFSVEWDINESITQYKMVKLTLQPLIENALSHGIGKLDQKALIKVECYEFEKKIEFIISDNGVGIDEDNISIIRERLKDSTLEDSDHLGLVNVNQRIQLAFGLDYGIQVESCLGRGTKVKMTLPKVQ